MHVRARERPYSSLCIDSFLSPANSQRRISRLLRVVSSRSEFSTRHPFLLSSQNLLPRFYSSPLSLSFGSSIGECTESHRYTCTQATRRHTYTCWTNSPLGHPFDKHNHERREARTHAHGCSHGVAVPLANYFCLVSLKTITSLRV